MAKCCGVLVREQIGLPVAIEGFRKALLQRKATLGDIANQAERRGVGMVICPIWRRRPPTFREVKDVGASVRGCICISKRLQWHNVTAVDGRGTALNGQSRIALFAFCHDLALCDDTKPLGTHRLDGVARMEYDEACGFAHG